MSYHTCASRPHAVASSIIFALSAMITLAAQSAAASPTQRLQVNQRGSFLLIGNALAFDCATGLPTPLVGTVGSCGTNTADTGADVFWRSESPNSLQAQADASITVAAARSEAQLSLPLGAKVTYARLYWAAESSGTAAGLSATLARPNAFSQALTADSNQTATFGGTTFYESSVDVTTLVQAYGSGTYQVSGIDSVSLLNRYDASAFAGWHLIVFYATALDPPRLLTLTDGFDLVQSASSANLSFANYVLPTLFSNAVLGVVAYKGSSAVTGDQLLVNGIAQANAVNPTTNFFNGTRSTLGLSTTVFGDLPQLSGLAGSMMGMDMDVIDVTAALPATGNTVTAQAKTSSDTFFLGTSVSAITTVAPLFSTCVLSVVNETEVSPNRPGDTLMYTITAVNAGNDAATKVVASMVLPSGVTYIANSLTVVSGANAGSKTDAAGDDQAEFVSASNTVNFRLGTGANATSGGSYQTSDAVTVVTFEVIVNANATGTIAAQAVFVAQGTAAAQAGIGPMTFNTLNPNGVVAPTLLVLDNCRTNADCGGGTPHCNTLAHPYQCTGCVVNTECAGGTPVCLNSTCVRCATTADCAVGAVCNTTTNQCLLAAPTIVSPVSNATLNTTPTVSGSATANANVTVNVDGAAVVTVTADASGSWIAPLPMSLGIGTHAVAAVATVGSGVLSTASGFSPTTYFNMIAGCLSNGDCSGANPVCNTASFQCVAAW